MIKVFTENLGLKLFALLLAVGIIWIKAQEKIQRRTLSGVQIVVDNLPENIFLPPEPWIPPSVKVTIQGPKNTIEFVRPNQFSFHIDLSKISLPEAGSSVNVFLTKDMFKTNLFEEDRMRISVVDGSIFPSQVALQILPWELGQPRPSLTHVDSSPNQRTIPLLLIEKSVPIVIPKYGNPPEEITLESLNPEPDEILVTGNMEAVQRIQSVSTAMLDLSMISTDTKPVFLQLQGLGRIFGVWPVKDNINGATVYFEVHRKR